MPLKPQYLFILVIIIWAVNMIFTKIGLQYMTPTLFALSRTLTATVVMFVFLTFRRQLILPNRKDLPLILSIGLIQIGIFQVLMIIGVSYVNAGRAAILVYSTPLWAVPIAFVFFQEKITFSKIFGLVLGMLGLLILFSPENFDWSSFEIILGNGLLLLASLCWAGTIVHTRFGKWHRPPLELIPWQLLIACIPSMLAVFIVKNDMETHWNITLISIILYSGFIATAFGYWVSITVNKNLPVIITSLSMLAVPILSLILSVLILGETLTLGAILAIFLIIFGLAVIIFEKPLVKALLNLFKDIKMIAFAAKNNETKS